MNVEAVGTRPVGRPPGPHDDTLAKILPTALRLLLAEGAAVLTPTRLHRETGVARATIYRNWPEPAALVEIMLQRAADGSDGFSSASDPGLDPEPDPGLDPAPDPGLGLGAALSRLAERLQEPTIEALLIAGMEHGRRSEPVAVAVRRFAAVLLGPLRRAIEVAVTGDEGGGATTAGDVTVDELLAELAGPLLLDRLLGNSLDSARARAVAGRVLAAHAARD